MHDIRILDAAAHELKRLDKPVGRRIVKHIRWLAENMDEIQPESLTGNLAGFYKLRVGDCRIIYEILHTDQAIIIHLIGHRREIYKR